MAQFFLMHIAPATILITASILLILGILASKASSKLGVPALLLFIVLGMLAGSEGIGRIDFDNPHQAQFLGIVALALILFAGGLDTHWKKVRSVLWQGVSLSTLGIGLTAVLLGLACHYLLGFSVGEAILLGSIVSSTDAAAVFSVLRSKHVGLKESLQSLLELESGSNDPMAVFLTVSLIGWLTRPHVTPAMYALAFVQQMVLGVVLGWGLGRIAVYLLNRLRLEYEGLYPVLSLGLVLFAYSLTDVVGGSGFLAVYVMAITMGNEGFVHKKSLIRFHDGLAWLMQIVMFIVLGLLVFPSHLKRVIAPGLIVAGLLIFVIRPLAVLVSLLASRVSFKEKAIISWGGLRGSAPIILATFPLVAGLPDAELIYNLVFFTVLASVLLQGTTIPAMARWLGVSGPVGRVTRAPIEFEAEDGETELQEIIIPYNAEVAGNPILRLGLPADSLIALIARDNQYVVPTGSTVLQEGDIVWALLNKKNARRTIGILSRQRKDLHASMA